MLSGKQTRYLRGLGHELNPVVRIGQAGVSAAVLSKTAEELQAHELIKVKLGDGCLEEPLAVGKLLAEGCGAELVQKIGKTLILYRRRKEEPTIELPR